jgi:hypothetical protein
LKVPDPVFFSVIVILGESPTWQMWDVGAAVNATGSVATEVAATLGKRRLETRISTITAVTGTRVFVNDLDRIDFRVGTG